MYKAQNYFVVTRLMRVFVLLVMVGFLIAVLAFAAPNNMATTNSVEEGTVNLVELHASNVRLSNNDVTNRIAQTSSLRLAE